MKHVERRRRSVTPSRSAVLSLLLVGCASTPSRVPAELSVNIPETRSASGPEAVEAESARWSFTLEPFLWLAGIDGKGGDGSAPPVDIGQNVSLFGHIDGGFLLALEARAPGERFSLLADGLHISLADDEGALQTDTDAWMLELGAGLPLGGTTWEALAGLRYVNLEFGTEVTGNARKSTTQDWIDPWIGARGRIALGEGFELGLRGDVGGFGVGTQLTWQGLAAFGAELGESVRLDFGYRAISLDFDDGDLTYDALVHGPFIAFAFRL